MFKTGVEQMITILDEIATESDIGKMYMDACMWSFAGGNNNRY